MKNSMPKPRLINILFWAIAVAFSLLYWGLINPETITDTGKIASACLFAILCLALLCWTIYYCYYLIFVNENNKLPWDSWMLYASLFFLYVGVNLLSVFSLFEIQKIYICEIFFLFFLACIFARILFNIIRKSGFFAYTEENIALFIAIFFGAFIIAIYFQTSLAANIIADILMGCISVLLITFMLKTFVVEQVKLKSLSDIMNFVFLFLTTIATSITTIYLLFWGLEADNHDLFNSIITVFAGVLGGALTLAGVAWTIRSQREKDHKEEVLKCKPLFRYCEKDDAQNKEIDQTFNFTKGNALLKNCFEGGFCFKNFAESVFEIQSIEVNGNVFTPLEYALVEKNTYFNIRFYKSSEGVSSFCMNVVDILGNPYRFELVRGEEGEITGIREVKKK